MVYAGDRSAVPSAGRGPRPGRVRSSRPGRFRPRRSVGCRAHPSGLGHRAALRRDRGSASVWVALCITLFGVLFIAVLTLGQAVTARHRSAAAADLAALAAADRALLSTGQACDAARRVAAANGGRLVRCRVQGETVDLTASVRAGLFAPRARSRAGPAGGSATPAVTGGVP